MDYEKKYKEALEIARKELQTCGSTDCDAARQIFRFFPELKKSDDERIRKKLLSSFKGIMADADEDELWYGLPYNDIIVWLEKQGEQKPYGQREECLDCQFNYVGECKGSCAMKRNEQKSADKVEPKFKVGDWVVKGDTIAQILDIQEQYYVGLDINGKDFTSSRFLNDDKIHLWTIKDAKDGDVLQLGVVTVIFQEYIGNGNCKCYCSVCNGEFEIPTKDESYGTFNATPATKEQRDILFAKMTEEGYEWSEDTHELKKISQRTISAEAKEALWSDKYEGLTDFERTLADICIGWIGEELGWKQYIKDNADVLLKIAIEKFNSVQDISFKQKPAWSEENEKILNNLIDYIKVDDALQYSEKQVVDWLKSLKNRVISQPDMIEALRTEYEKGRADTIAEMEKEWSEEDEEIINGITGYLCTHDSCELDGFNKWYDWLKSLKDRVTPRQKPEWTEEDEKRLKSCLNILQPKTLLGNVETINTNWLKSLKDRYTWRPSNEQIEALGHFIRSISESGYASPYDNNTKLLYSLLEQLKKLKA